MLNFYIIISIINIIIIITTIIIIGLWGLVAAESTLGTQGAECHHQNP